VITNRGAKMIAACIPNYPFLRLTPGFALTQHIALVRSEVHSILPPTVALCPVDREAGTVRDGVTIGAFGALADPPEVGAGSQKVGFAAPRLPPQLEFRRVSRVSLPIQGS
jgi:hypothetical protein